MPATAELYIVGDTDLDDRYIAELMPGFRRSLFASNIIVRIRFVLRYPIQHAIIWPDVPRENAPLREGLICLLTPFRKATKEEIARFATYEESLNAARWAALVQARQQGDRNTEEILIRHMRGEIADKRVLMTFREWEL